MRVWSAQQFLENIKPARDLWHKYQELQKETLNVKQQLDCAHERLCVLLEQLVSERPERQTRDATV
ncbi:hypothetical protein HY642_02475 [Candidatus Woesearchaeota archaeon]|nr:hypothetical protein [Candidatus Woesearchaeota archaeon]